MLSFLNSFTVPIQLCVLMILYKEETAKRQIFLLPISLVKSLIILSHL